jgi:hypothetical protein
MRYQDQLDKKSLERYAAAINRRARLLQAVGEVSPALLRHCILESSGCCGWCGDDVTYSEFEIDHIISLSQGGRNVRDNLVLACPACNRKKGEKHPVRFAAERYAQHGRLTPLLEQLFAQYDVEPQQQATLFETNAVDDRVQIETDDDDQPPEIPPYTW